MSGNAQTFPRTSIPTTIPGLRDGSRRNVIPIRTAGETLACGSHIARWRICLTPYQFAWRHAEQHLLRDTGIGTYIYIYILRLVQCLMGAQPLESFTLCHTGALPTKDRLCLTHPHGGTPASSKSYQSSRRHGLGRGGAGEGPRTICCARGFCPYFWGVREPYPAKVRLCLTNLHGGTPASAKSGSTSLTSCCRTIVLLLKLSVFLLTQLRMSWFYNDLEFQLGLFLP